MEGIFSTSYLFFSAVSDGVSLDQPLVIYHSKYLEFLGLKSLRYMDMTAYLEELPSLCYTSALEKILPVRTKGVKDPATCSKLTCCFEQGSLTYLW